MKIENCTNAYFDSFFQWLREMRENLHAPKPGDTPKQSAVFLVQSLAERSGTSQTVPAKRKLLTEDKKPRRYINR